MSDDHTAYPSPIYDIEKTYMENAKDGPFFTKSIPKRAWPKKETWRDFLGFKIASSIGVPAGPLLNQRWVQLAGNLGYDILCYKTIRSQEYPGHPLPNILYVEPKPQLSPAAPRKTLRQRPSPPARIEDVAITNSFGMPSRGPDFLQKDIQTSYASLQHGQALIISIVGTPNAPRGFFEDFAYTAALAKEWGAKIIEANFSCPNVAAGTGCLYNDPEAVRTIASKIVHAIGDTPLIVKLGIFPDKDSMKKTFIAAAKAGVRAVAGINTLSRKVVDSKGTPALGSRRPSSGICGNPIRSAALKFVRDATDIVRKEKLALTIIGGGGIMLPEHFDAFFEAGADAAMTATGMMWDPFLAAKYHMRTA